VTAFSTTVGNLVGRTVVQEQGEARAEFAAAVLQGQSAYLAEQVRADIFCISVENLPRNATVTVLLTYVVALEVVGGEGTMQFVFPIAVAPLLANGTDNMESARSGARRV